jgi:hypothetical protein
MPAVEREAGPEKLEMAFPRAIVAQKARAREETIIEHLVKLLAFDVPEETRGVWRKEIARHPRFLAALRVKPSAGLIPAQDWRTWLYAAPFEDNEAGYTSGLIAMNADDFPRNGRGVDEIAGVIRDIHVGLSARLARGEAAQDLIPA